MHGPRAHVCARVHTHVYARVHTHVYVHVYMHVYVHAWYIAPANILKRL